MAPWSHDLGIRRLARPQNGFILAVFEIVPADYIANAIESRASKRAEVGKLTSSATR